MEILDFLPWLYFRFFMQEVAKTYTIQIMAFQQIFHIQFDKGHKLQIQQEYSWLDLHFKTLHSSTNCNSMSTWYSHSGRVQNFTDSLNMAHKSFNTVIGKPKLWKLWCHFVIKYPLSMYQYTNSNARSKGVSILMRWRLHLDI